MPNFTKVGSQYVLSNLDIKVPSLDSVMIVNKNKDISSLPICRDYINNLDNDSYNKDSILTFGSLGEYAKLNGSHSYYGLYNGSWNLSNQYTNIGNSELYENDLVKRTAYSMTVKRSLEALLTFNGKVKNNSDSTGFVWFRIMDNNSATSNAKNRVKLEGIRTIPPKTYTHVTFSESVPTFIGKGAILTFEMSCNSGGNIEVDGIGTLAWLTCLHLYPNS